MSLTTYTVQEVRKGKWDKGTKFVKWEDFQRRTMALEMALVLGSDATVNVLDTTPGNRSSYQLTLWGAARADGGYLTVRFMCPGQQDMVEAESFDVAYADWYAGGMCCPSDSLKHKMRAALETLRVKRDRLAEADFESRRKAVR